METQEFLYLIGEKECIIFQQNQKIAELQKDLEYLKQLVEKLEQDSNGRLEQPNT